MKIKEYLQKTGIQQKTLAEHVGVTWKYLWCVMQGKYNPSMMLAHQISTFTNGEVKVHEIRKCNSTCAPGCACSQGEKKSELHKS